jgi:membrane fusion protein (multidrug efflux system)
MYCNTPRGEKTCPSWSVATHPGNGVIFLVLTSILAFGGCSGQPSAPPPVTPDVAVSPVVQKDVPLYGEWIGTLDGYVNAEIRPQVSGYLVKQTYQDGDAVRKGAVLFEINPRPFQAALDQAKGKLAQAEAQLGKAKIDVERDTPLAKAKAIPQRQLDDDIQALLGSEAAVAAARAAVEEAQINLGFTKVTSLVDGIAGIAQMQVGSFVGQSSLLTTVSQVDPIKAYFTVSEQEYLAFNRRFPSDASRAAEEERLQLELILADGTTYPQKGKFYFADRQVNQGTGTIRIAGLFANPGNVLRPGQYGRIRTATNLAKGALLVPQRAVTELQGSHQLAVVDGDNKVDIRTVKVGEQVGALWIIADGLKPGERVIAEGADKVRTGMQVNPMPFAAAAAVAER